MNKLRLNTEIQLLPSTTKSMLWQFVRGDVNIRTFENWVYSDNELSQVIEDDSYLELIMMDYLDKHETDTLENTIYKFLMEFPESCLCSRMPNKTKLLYPLEEVDLEKQFNLFKTALKIEDFSGTPAIHYSKWYHPGELCYCTECHTWWFIIFEESDVDYYLVRVGNDDAKLISQSPSWPNENWPAELKDWHSFICLNFQSYDALYRDR